LIKQLIAIMFGVVFGYTIPFLIGLLFWPVGEYDKVWLFMCVIYSFFCAIAGGVIFNGEENRTNRY